MTIEDVKHEAEVLAVLNSATMRHLWVLAEPVPFAWRAASE